MAASIWNPGNQSTQTSPAVAPFQFQKGSAAAPGITFVGDTDTGICSLGDGLIHFVSNGVIVLTVDTDGNIIGDTLVGKTEISIPAAATIDLGNIKSSSIYITGAATITSFGTNFKGPKYLRFQNNLTIQNSSTLICPGGANITVRAGDTLIVNPKATVSGTLDGWVVVSYLNANDVTDLSNILRADIPAATNTVLLFSSIATRNVRITGAATITSFSADAGGLYFVTFSGASTLVNSTVLVTNSGANIVTTAGDSCIIRATAYNEVEVLCYTYASVTPAPFGVGRVPSFVLDVQSSGNAIGRVRSGAGNGAGWAATLPNTDTTMFGFLDKFLTTGGTQGTIASLFTASGIPLIFEAGGSEKGRFDPSTGVLSVTAGIRVPPVAFASLPASPVAGQRAMINNSPAAPAFNSAAAGGGAVTVPVFYDGTTWRVG